MCGLCAVVCEDFKFFKVPLCVGSVLWCVGTLIFFKVPLCVSSVLWCVGTLNFLKFPCVLALYRDFPPVCDFLVLEDFERKNE